ncbi:hypothetical protein [Odoribacter laneus]|uniref:Uncharacterized protein n=1 Tax=Odoribacter laneus YIT 12061 TaxID=742817 RepID=H1DHR8_9BACT|nr:hypothetical protein [Odoribacter laneus]EHP47197.1 hypothetical protein HMPREF9449_01804 [Odoribacter laneus YIT 12061]
MDTHHITNLISQAYEAGYKRCLEDTGVLPKFLTLKQAYKIYKRRNVELWIKEKLITPLKISGKRNGAIKISRERLELLASLSYVDRVYGIIPPENKEEYDGIF